MSDFFLIGCGLDCFTDVIGSADAHRADPAQSVVHRR